MQSYAWNLWFNLEETQTRRALLLLTANAYLTDLWRDFMCSSASPPCPMLRKLNLTAGK